MHLMLRLPARYLPMNPREFERLVVAQAALLGVGVYPVGPCRSGPAKEAALLLGYASMPEARIAEGIAPLAEVIQPLLRA
jgi:DNA-binding transcriptional MocR family regulator